MKIPSWILMRTRDPGQDVRQSAIPECPAVRRVDQIIIFLLISFIRCPRVIQWIKSGISLSPKRVPIEIFGFTFQIFKITNSLWGAYNWKTDLFQIFSLDVLGKKCYIYKHKHVDTHRLNQFVIAQRNKLWVLLFKTRLLDDLLFNLSQSWDRSHMLVTGPTLQMKHQSLLDTPS